MTSQLVSVTTMDNTVITFHVDRMFGITAPFKDEKTGEVFDCVIALKTIEHEKVALLPVKETQASVIAAWDEALRAIITMRVR